jgi:glycosyltransferase involved in cell wall biosynthesis
VSRGDLAWVARARGVIINNAVDLEKVTDAARSLRADLESLLTTIGQDAVIGIVARLAYDKGIDIAIEAAARVCQTVPGTRFVFAGDAIFGETDYKRSLMELVVQLDLQDHVTFVGHREDVLALMERCDLIVLPSRRESFGLALIEAGALARPVVATKVGGVPEVVVDGETGLLVPPEDAEALAGAILRLLRDPELAGRLGHNARRRVEQRFTIQRAADNLLALYHELVRT